MEKNNEIWKVGMTEEEIKNIKKTLGENFENVPQKITKYSGTISTDETIKKIGREMEGKLTEEEVFSKESNSPIKKVQELKEEIIKLEIEKNEIINSLSKSDNKEVLQNKKGEMLKLINQIEEKNAEIENLINSN